MRKVVKFIFLSIIFIAVSSPAYAQVQFVKFGNGHDADFWGTQGAYFNATFPSTRQFLAERGKTQIVPGGLDLNNENVFDVFNGEYGFFDVIVISEEIGDDLNENSYEMFREYVSGGGCVIVTGDHADNEDTFLNNAFGFDIGVVEIGSDAPLPSANIQAAAGAFGGGPSELVSANLTTAYTNTPGQSVYVGSEGDWLFTVEFGAGRIAAIGFDYCCIWDDDEAFITPQEILDWYDVADRAFNYCTGTGVTNVPTLSEWGLIATAGLLGIIGFIVIRRRQLTINS